MVGFGILDGDELAKRVGHKEQSAEERCRCLIFSDMRWFRETERVAILNQVSCLQTRSCHRPRSTERLLARATRLRPWETCTSRRTYVLRRE